LERPGFQAQRDRLEVRGRKDPRGLLGLPGQQVQPVLPALVGRRDPQGRLDLRVLRDKLVHLASVESPDSPEVPVQLVQTAIQVYPALLDLVERPELLEHQAKMD